MSEERQKTHSFLLYSQAKGRAKIELYPAVQWRRVWRYGKGASFDPKPTINKMWWAKKYRVRIGGKWLRRGNAKYTFFNKTEVRSIILQNAGI